MELTMSLPFEGPEKLLSFCKYVPLIVPICTIAMSVEGCISLDSTGSKFENSTCIWSGPFITLCIPSRYLLQTKIIHPKAATSKAKISTPYMPSLQDPRCKLSRSTPSVGRISPRPQQQRDMVMPPSIPSLHEKPHPHFGPKSSALPVILP